ncbi:MAG: hypothetical protein H6557_04085 [Lewinellaceae bacterium]|nr:hypothetical protein [Phaeodactylibacter sp.]MCB9035779.1 hypothetical protein [Lewinellaceae bacterium]
MKPKKEANKYDKIIKENLEALFLPFLEQLMNIRILSFEGFELIDIGRLDFGQLLSSQIPEVVVLAILADFKKKPPEVAIRSIVKRLQKVAKGELSLEKYIRQLNVLSGLRKLHELTIKTIKTIETMPITYDIETDFLYKKGKEEGLKEGFEAGEERKEYIFVERGRKKGMTAEEIAELADMPVERVKAIIRELEAGSKGEG